MCGRYRLNPKERQLEDLFQLEFSDVRLEPRFNIAPSQRAFVVRFDPERDARRVDTLKWGLVPHWAKDVKVGFKMINARSETVATSGAFRQAFAKRRCLIPATGFYEWRKDSPTQKTPFSIQLRDEMPFAFAGLWEGWRASETDEWLHTFTIITCVPNEAVQPLHDRMPVILPREAHETWLRQSDPSLLKSLLRPFDAAAMTTFPISKLVNTPKNDSSAILTPAPSGAAA